MKVTGPTVEASAVQDGPIDVQFKFIR